MYITNKQSGIWITYIELEIGINFGEDKIHIQSDVLK